MNSRILPTGMVVFVALLASCSPLLEVSNVAMKPDSFEYADTMSDGWIRLWTDSLWGFYHAERKRLITPQLEWVGNFHDGHALVRKDSLYFFLDTKGKVRRKRSFGWAYGYTEGKAAVQRDDKKFGYLNTRGKWSIQPRFDWALPFDRGQAIVVQDDQYGLIGAQGETLVLAQYDEIRAYSENLYRVRNGNRLGLLDRNGHLVLPMQYEKIELLENEFSLITAVDGQRGMVDPDGKLVLSVEFSSIGDIVSGRFRFVQKDQHHGLIDRSGKIIVPPIYAQLGLPAENRIAAFKDGKWGYLDFSGNVALPFAYPDEAEASVSRNFRENRAWATTESHFLLIDTLGRTIREIPRDAFDHAYGFQHGRAFIRQDSTSYYRSFGFIDREGNTVIPPRYHAVGAFNKYGIGWLGYSKNRDSFVSYWLVDTTGQPINDRQYNRLERIGEHYLLGTKGEKILIDPRTGRELELETTAMQERKNRDKTIFYAVTDLGGETRLLDSDMQQVIPAGYRSFGSMDHTLLWVYKDRKWGLADYQGRLRIPALYDTESGWSSDGLFTASKNRLRGVIDTMGREIIPFRYNNVYVDKFFGHIIAHGKGEAKTDLFDSNGRPISVGEWDYIGGFYSKDFTYVRNDGKIGVLDMQMNVICEPIYDRIGRFRSDDGMAWVVLDKKIGYVDRNFNLVIPIEYDNGTHFANGIVRVKKNGETLYLERSGKQVFSTPGEIEAYEKALEKKEHAAGSAMFSS